MEWLLFVPLVCGVMVAILLLAIRAARPESRIPREPDDPHAGLLREVAGQEGPRIYPP